MGDASDLVRIRRRHVGERITPHRRFSLHGEVNVWCVLLPAVASGIDRANRRDARSQIKTALTSHHLKLTTENVTKSAYDRVQSQNDLVIFYKPSHRHDVIGVL